MPGTRPMDDPPLPPQTHRHRQREKSKEHSRKLQPKHPRQPRERSPYRLPKTLTLPLQSPPRLSNLGSDGRSLRSRWSGPRSSSAIRPHPAILRRRARSRSRVHRLRHRLGRQTSPDTQYAPKPLRIHTRQCSPSPSPIQESFRCIQPASESAETGKPASYPNKGDVANEKFSLDAHRPLCCRRRNRPLGPKAQSTRAGTRPSPRRGLGRSPHSRIIAIPQLAQITVATKPPLAYSVPEHQARQRCRNAVPADC
jgi:hypothetical protein